MGLDEQGRSVVVTGAGRGIGYATAILLAEEGWHVVGIDSDAAFVDALRVRLGEGGDAVCGDVTQDATLAKARQCAEAMGRLSAWVNNAGADRLAPLHEMTREHAERSLSVNLLAQLMGCREALQSFVESGTPGSIVNMSSIHARASFVGYAAYGASKGGVETLTRAVAVEYGPRGIRCNAIAPGSVLTEGVRLQIDRAADPARMYAETIALSPMNRTADPSDIANAVSFLLSDRAGFITGHVLVVDGGATARCSAAVFP